VAATYISEQEFTDWAAPFTVTDSTQLGRTRERASRDVDFYLGPWARESDGSLFGDLTVNPKGLTAEQIAQLKNAVCAQALYRIQNGEDWALGGGDLYASASGPDFNVTSKRPRVSPQARQELQGSGLVIRGATLTPRRRWGAVW
jgi:hypothetical protein